MMMTMQTVYSRRLTAPISLQAAGGRASFFRELDAVLRACRISRPARPSLSVCSAGHGVASDADPVLRQPTRMGRVVSFIDDNLDAPLTLDRLAEEAELSKYHFSRVFRQEVGLPPWSFVRRARVDRARGLLERGASPAAAAVEAGFCDQSHLTRAMKEIVGKTPKQVQKGLHRNDRKDVREDRKDVQE
jgi:AraC-like DNA-binding protein